jgi:hypothetical protein
MNLGAIEVRTQAPRAKLKPSFAMKQYLKSRHSGALLELSRKAALIGRFQSVSALYRDGVFAKKEDKMSCCTAEF